MSIKDLHICRGSLTSKSETEPCVYGPEYAYSELPPEGYSSESSISWQHFPRSTSTRSGPCEDSDESAKKSESSEPELPPVQEEGVKASTTEYPITKSISQLNAMHYLEIRHVFEFLNFLLAHLVCNEPENPVDFLVELLKKCLEYRDSFGEPPLLFTTAHIRALYYAFDPFERGHLTEKQYHEAMRSLGLEYSITPYNRSPMMSEEGYVDKSYFLFEAEKCLTENLRKMLRIPRIWEENRLVWKKKMKKAEAKRITLGEKPLVEESVFQEEPGEHVPSKTFIPPHLNFIVCLQQGKPQFEPEQLFFN